MALALPAPAWAQAPVEAISQVARVGGHVEVAARLRMLFEAAHENRHIVRPIIYDLAEVDTDIADFLYAMRTTGLEPEALEVLDANPKAKFFLESVARGLPQGLSPTTAEKRMTCTGPDCLARLDTELKEITLVGGPQLEKLSDYQRSVAAWILEVPPDQLEEAIAADTPEAHLVRASFAPHAERGVILDTWVLREWLGGTYYATRGFPRSLAEFRESVFDYGQTQPIRIDSRVKRTERRIYRDPKNGVSVAETVEDGHTREVEVILGGRRKDGALDFLVYGEDGELQTWSKFPTANGLKPKENPFTCFACHRSGNGLSRFDLRFPARMAGPVIKDGS